MLNKISIFLKKALFIAILIITGPHYLYASASLEIWTNYLPMPDPIIIHYNPAITTNHDLFMQIQAATGNPPAGLEVDLGAGLYLPDNNDLVDQSKFLMRNSAGKPKIVAINRL